MVHSKECGKPRFTLVSSNESTKAVELKFKNLSTRKLSQYYCTKMKILETIRKNLNASGFKANDTILNRYNVWAILVSTSAIASHIAYILYEVNTVDEYMRTIFMLTVGCAILMSFLTMVVRKGELNNLIDNFQAIITEGE